LISLNFLIPSAMPGDPIQGLIARGPSGFSMGPEQRDAFKAYYHLDGSLASQYGHYLSRLAHGDLGRSIGSNSPVRHDIARKLPWTVLPITSSILLATVIGLVAGVHSGWRRDRKVDRALMTMLLAVREFPTFLLASLLFGAKFSSRTPPSLQAATGYANRAFDDLAAKLVTFDRAERKSIVAQMQKILADDLPVMPL